MRVKPTPHKLWAPILLAVIAIAIVDGGVLIADFQMSRMIELQSRIPYCRLHTDRGDIQRMILASDSKRMRLVPRDSVQALETVCNEADNASTEIEGGLGFIYPGTKWCGPGNISKYYNDLGRYADEDRCCREHDHCPQNLLPGDCRRGLCNYGTVTRSHCDCDIRFRRCLQNIQTETANTLGAIFFNVIQVTCFRERRPCSVWQSYNGKCPYQFDRIGLYKYNLTLPYIFPDLDKLRAIPSEYGRSYSSGSDLEEGANTPKEAVRIRVDSLNLIARNFYREYVVKPVKRWAGYNKTLADELCSRWKYQPSENYIPMTPHKGFY